MTAAATTKSTLINIVNDEVSRVCNLLRVSVPEYTVDTFDIGTHGGSCSYYSINKAFKLSFNTSLYNRYPEQFINTIRHEIAHMMQRIIYPNAKQAHGPEFRKIFTYIGGDGKRTHSYDVTGLRKKKVKRHIYVCGCTQHKVATQTHNKMQLHGAHFVCRYCSDKINYKETIVLE